MDCLLGIDLGTSSVRSMIMSYDGRIISLAQEEYNFDITHEGWAEQDPELWWNATVRTIRKALYTAETNVSVKSIGFSGQMHGLVAIDAKGKCVRKAILWCDQRSAPQVEKINNYWGREQLGKIIHSPMATGFQVASILWVKENEPEVYSKISHVILPKDYIRYRLTGEIASDITDAASTGCFDCNAGTWSCELLSAFDIDKDLFPRIGYPHEIAGFVTLHASSETGIENGTTVAYGGADQVMQAIGNGIIEPGIASVTIGTGGQILMPLTNSVYDKGLRSHSFCFFAPQTWYYMGAALSSGLALKWGRTLFNTSESFKEIDDKCEPIKSGSEGLIFLPYLAGERTPHMDPYARSTFFGLTLSHTRYHLYRSIMEGVAYSMKDCLSILTEDLNQECNMLIASGGGAKSKLWTQIQADVLGREIFKSNMKEQASYGAAIAAGIANGTFSNYKDACSFLVKWSDEPVVPNERNRNLYEEYFLIYKSLYFKTKDLMLACGSVLQD